MSKFKKMLSESEQGEDVENVEDIQELNDEDLTEAEETEEASSDIDSNEHEDVSEVEAVEKKSKRAEKKAQIAASRKRKESNAKQRVDQVALYPQKEMQITQKIKLSEHITLLAAIGAVIFSALAVFSNNSLSTQQYNATTQGLWKAQKGQFAVLRSESSDALTQLNDKLTALDATQSDIKAAMKRLNENVQTLNKNLNQVQENMLGQMKQLGTPDLSKIESAITAMNTNKNDVTASQQSYQEDKQAEHFDETQIVDKASKANEANKENEKNKKFVSDVKGAKASTQNIDDKQQNKTKTVKAAQHTLLYLGNTPNGAVIKLDGEYLTVQVGQKTVVGTVTLISNKQIVIGNTSYVYQAG
ncbi:MULTISPECIES: hypothetical protein [Cysteiniphilum]|uniref:Uncharacterized protein n=1 Tax=Cysteiniphilum litorale TaxID=2056700 RepID=A0A8J2Z372_9GAMM|nr:MULTISPECIES: hypothetical protein [Cysteiniphilum]GGF92375.1 hypothetical protein GCM10010995_06950 [Cysteiniphilum litorale]